MPPFVNNASIEWAGRMPHGWLPASGVVGRSDIDWTFESGKGRTLVLKSNGMYQRTTHAIRITVKPSFLEEQSQPEQGYFVWAYTITIENRSGETVTLKTRYWQIVDAKGQMQEVRGAGVVGEQPTLKPGERFEYTSGAPLTTPSGFMVGSYQMETAQGEAINVDIPAFSLDSPYAPKQVH
jgi:ApaG protein